MFLAYIDEVAEPGAFVSKQDRRYNGSPAFGYAGFVIRDDRVRDFSRIFSTSKRKLFWHEIRKDEASRQMGTQRIGHLHGKGMGRRTQAN